MAHEIHITETGKAAMAFVGNRSEIWHGLGNELTVGSSIETWQTEAGMDWEINSSPVVFGDQESMPHEFGGKQILYRSDTKAPLSMVSSRYKVVQPKEVMEFFRSLTEDAGMQLNTAGVLFGGQRFWALADTAHELKVGGKDLVKGYLLLSTSCDGTLATTAQFTSCRVVCNNTLNIALEDGKKTRVSTKHSTTFKPNEVKSQMGLYESAWEKFGRQMEQMQAVKVSAKDAFADIMHLLCVDAADPTAAEIQTVNKIHGLYLGGGMGADIAGRSAFGVLNSITEYWDHHVGRIPSNQLASSFWGTGSQRKQMAMDYLTETYGIEA
jgi:phage/plasmid-like protein (TIGR03299 family)